MEHLRHQPLPGVQSRLSPQQLMELRGLLTQGTEAFGFIGEVWTSKRVAAVIKRFLGVTYHRAYVSRLLPALGFSVQKPLVRATQGHDAVIAPGGMSTGPHSKKRYRPAATIIWVDESGFYLLPARVRTYAPRSQTPMLRVPLTRDHRSLVR